MNSYRPAHNRGLYQPRIGSVVLVGGGPGAADLITLRGYRALMSADVVVADRLAPVGLIEELPMGIEVIDVGKQPGRHTRTQEQINSLLIEHARMGRRVVRLKGGDSFLFGRGGEEAAACEANGIPVEVVPGVSSALAAPAAAGIPVTHRGIADAVQIAHGHRPVAQSAWASVAGGTCTLVLLMAVAELQAHVAAALTAGVDPSTPAAIIESGTLPQQRITRSTLEALPALAEALGVQPPAVIVLGRVAAADALRAFVAQAS